MGNDGTIDGYGLGIEADGYAIEGVGVAIVADGITKLIGGGSGD